MQYAYIKTIGNNIYTTKIDGQKRIYEVDEKHKPYLWTLSTRDTGWTSYPEGKRLQKIEYGSIRDMNESLSSYPDDFIYGNIGNKLFEVQKIRNEKLNKNVVIDDVNIWFYDIEVYSTDGFPNPQNAEHMITAITFKNANTNKIYTFTILKGYKPHLENVKCKSYDRETDMLSDVLTFIAKSKIDVLSAWNGENFDDPYLVNRCQRLGLNLKMGSPFNMIRNKVVRPMNGLEFKTVELVGVCFVDLMVAYKHLVPGERESYSLNNISKTELNDEKIDYSDEGSLNDLMMNNPQKYIEYNIQDVELCDGINGKKKLIQSLFSMIYYVGASMESSNSNTILWDIFLYNELLDRKMVCPPKPKTTDNSSFIGAYVKEPKKGLHKWGASFDLNSLYPHLIAQYNLSPDTKINTDDLPEELKKVSLEFKKANIEKTIESIVNEEIDFSEFHKHNIIILPGGACFKKDKQGLVPELMMNLYQQRKEHKRESLEYQQKAINETDENLKKQYSNKSKAFDNLQYTEKIFLNAGYGAFTFKSFRYFDRDMAESITSSGQVSVKYLSTRLDKFIAEKTKTAESNLYNDTDSGYFSLLGFVDMIKSKNPTTEQIVNYLDNICKKVIEPEIERIYDKMSKYVAVYENKMVMKREVIFESAFWVAKKRYAMKIWDNEGVRYKEAKIKVKGMQIVRSDTPKLFRTMLKDSVEKILNGEFLNKIIQENKQYIMNCSPEDIAITSGVNGYEKYNCKGFLEYEKGTPIHVKATIFYNDLLKRFKVTSVKPYQPGDKIKYVFLKPNQYNIDIVGFINKLPEEFGLNDLVFNEKHFEKSYLTIINDLAINAGIDVVKKQKLF